MNAKKNPNPRITLCVKAWISSRQPECQEAVKAVRTVCRESERLLKTARGLIFYLYICNLKQEMKAK